MCGFLAVPIFANWISYLKWMCLWFFLHIRSLRSVMLEWDTGILFHFSFSFHSVLDDLPVKIALYGSVAVIVICILICIGCTLFLQDVTSNHSKIHCNFGVAVLLSELFFSCGIMVKLLLVYVCKICFEFWPFFIAYSKCLCMYGFSHIYSFLLHEHTGLGICGRFASL